MNDKDLELDAEDLAFPDAGEPAEILRYLLRYAILAPSSHNSQPWRFRIDGACVELRADPARRLAVADPQGRELVISCGAAGYALRVAMRHFGYTGESESLPDPDQPELLARIWLGGPRPPSDEDHRLFEALPQRRTHRGGFSESPLPEGLRERLAVAAAEEGATLIWRDGRGREELAELVASATLRLARSRAYRRELAGWVHGDAGMRRDGIPPEVFGFEGLLSYFGPLLLAHVNWGRQQAPRDQQAALTAPALAVLASAGDDTADWLACGEALQRLLLLAAAEGVQAGYLNAPVQVPELRQRLQRDLGRGPIPQMVLRLGKAPPMGRGTPRRPVAEVVESAGSPEPH